MAWPGSWLASPWVASASRTTSPRSSSSCAPRRRATSPATRWSRTAAGCSSRVDADVTTGQGALLELSDVHKSFGHIDVIKGVSLTVRKGEHVVIFGPSGGGKSTILRMMNLLEVPDSGRMIFEGKQYFPGTDNRLNRARILQ